MEKTLIFRSVDEIRLKKLLRLSFQLISPHYLLLFIRSLTESLFPPMLEQMHSLRSTLSIRL